MTGADVRRATLGAVVLILAACTPADTAPTTAPASTVAEAAGVDAAFDELLADVDLLVTMTPGTGAGPLADRLAREAGNPIPGTAEHLATVAGAEGPVQLVQYQEAMAEIRPAGVMFCTAEIGPSGAGAGCGGEPVLRPEAGSGTAHEGPGGHNSITAFGGPGAVVAVLKTEEGARIGILTVDGWAFAEWPSEWGFPDRITFYGPDAEPGFTAAYGWS